MTQRQLAYMAMRIGAVVIALTLLNKLPGALDPVAFAPNAAGRLLALLGMVFFLASAVLASAMWLFPVTVARRLGIWDLQADAAGGSAHWLTEALLAVAGLYLAALALADLAYYAAQHIALAEAFGTTAPLPPGTVGGYAASLVQLVLGLLLAIRGRQIAGFVGRLRPSEPNNGDET